MNCNLDLIVSSVVLNYLNTIDKNIGKLFQEKTKAFCLAKGSPVITDVFNHFIQTNSKSRKIKFIAVGDEQSTSEDDDVPEINLTGDDCITSIKVESSLNVFQARNSKMSQSHVSHVKQTTPSTSKVEEIVLENEQLENNTEPQFYIDRNSSEPLLNEIMVPEFSKGTSNHDLVEMRNVDNYNNNYRQHRNYYDRRNFHHPRQHNANQNKTSNNSKKQASKNNKYQNFKDAKKKKRETTKKKQECKNNKKKETRKVWS